MFFNFILIIVKPTIYTYKYNIYNSIKLCQFTANITNTFY